MNGSSEKRYATRGYWRVEKENIKTCKTIFNSYFKSFEQFFFENVESKERKLKTNKTIK